jgi:hypothetical protein
MESFVDEISPAYVGEDRIVLTLEEPGLVARAFNLISVLVNVTGCDPEGLMLPLELTLTNPRGRIVDRRYLRRRVPSSVTVRPQEGGPHLVRVAEVAHNRYWGSLVLNVTGERLSR